MTIHDLARQRAPSYYTKSEGGSWIRWPDNIVFNPKWLCARSTWTVLMGEIRVHAICFGEPAAGFDLIARWDCINGQTNMPEEIFY